MELSLDLGLLKLNTPILHVASKELGEEGCSILELLES